MIKNDLISIIIPIFNTEKYLSKTINSILSQSYKNIEVILVDDGSDDNSLSICKEYAKKDNRIVVIHNENSGVSKTRNIGLEQAKGDFISFVDSDDYIEKNMIEELYNLHLKTNSDITMCSIIRENQNGKEFEKIIYPNKTISQKKIIENTINDNIRDYLWNKLYKKDLFDEIEFPKGKIYEDVLTLYRLYSKANHLTSTDDVLYHYVNRENSIVNSSSGRKAQSLYDAYTKKLIDIESFYPEFASLCRYQRIIHEINYFIELSKEEKIDYTNLKEKINNLKNDCIFNHKYTVKQKIKYILMVYFTQLFILLRKRKMSKERQSYE